MSNFNMDKYREMLYGKGISVDTYKQIKLANRLKELADKMMKEFSKGGSVFLDDYSPEEVRVARKIYNEKQKHKAPDNIKSEIKGKWNDNETK